jgi:hypothetical protein
MRFIIAIVVTASSAYASSRAIEPHDDTADMNLIMEFATSGGVPAGQFSAFRRMSQFSTDQIARLHEIAQGDVEPIVRKMYQMDAAQESAPYDSDSDEEVTPDEITKKVIDVFQEFNEAYTEYTHFHEELRDHPESFAVSRRDLLIIRAYFREFGRLTSIERLMRSEYFLRSVDEASKFVLCKWFKIGFNEFSRQVALYLPGEPLGNEIGEYPFGTVTFDDHSKACVKMFL